MITRRDAAFTALAASDALLAVAGRDSERWLTKPLLMPALMPGRTKAAQRALALSWVGDVALLGSGDAAFQAGLVSFLAGHLAWIDALRKQPGRGRLRANPVLAVPPLDSRSVDGVVMATYAAAQALLARSTEH